MNTAWMLGNSGPRASCTGLRIEAVGILIACALVQMSGCTSGTLTSPFGRTPAEPSRTADGPLAARLPESGEQTPPDAPANRERPADAGDSTVNNQVDSFVARFPPDDRDRQTGAAGKSQPAGSQQGSAASPTFVSPITPMPTPTPAGATGSPTQTSPPTAVAATPDVAPATQPAVVSANRPVAPAPVPEPRGPHPAGPTTLPAAETTVHAQALTGRPVMSPAPTGTPRVELLDIRPAAMPMPATAATQPAASANQPTQPVTAPPAMDLGAFITELERSVQAHPAQLDEQFKLRLLYLATEQDEKAAGPMEGSDPVQGGLVTAVFDVLKAAKGTLRQPTSSPAPAILAVDELRRLLAQQSPVLIPKIALVTRVNSFGDYEAVNPPKFEAGQGVHVFLYTEVANFRSEPTPDGRLRTLLGAKVEIFDAAGKMIWQQSAAGIEDKVLSPRRDFFVPLEIRLPATTPAGEYVLKVTIEDKLGATTDQQRMTFVIGP